MPSLPWGWWGTATMNHVVESLWMMGKPLPKSLSPQQPFETRDSQSERMIPEIGHFSHSVNGTNRTFVQAHVGVHAVPMH